MGTVMEVRVSRDGVEDDDANVGAQQSTPPQVRNRGVQGFVQEGGEPKELVSASDATEWLGCL